VPHGTRTRNTSIEVGLARTRDELDAASRLVHRCYLRRGYVEPSADGRHTSPYLAMPSTAVFVARVDGRVVATVSLVRDSVLQLPCDELYAAELAAFRAAGHRLAEVSALAIDDEWRGPGLGVMRALVQAVAIYAREFARIDDLCIAVHPRHAPFYEARLRFQRFGDLRAYDAVNGAPAIGLRLDLRQVDRPAAGASFAASLFTPSERGRVRATLTRDLASRARAFEIPALSRPHATLRSATVTEVC
jgi:GNAT superfamily N-acetyltransferase